MGLQQPFVLCWQESHFQGGWAHIPTHTRALASDMYITCTPNAHLR